MKKHILSIVVWSLAISSFAPLCAQNEAPTWRQRAAQAWAAIPRPSLPSWAKGPGFEAAKKWWNAGRDKSVLTKQEKRAFNCFKKKFKIGTIISAIIIGVGRRLYKQRAAQAQVNYIIDRFIMKRNPTVDENELRAINIGIEGNPLIVNAIEKNDISLPLIAFGATAAGNTPLVNALLLRANRYLDNDNTYIAPEFRFLMVHIAFASALKNDKKRIYEILDLECINNDSLDVYENDADNPSAYTGESLKQSIAFIVSDTAATEGNDELVREMLNLEGIDKKQIKQSLEKDNLWKNEYDI